MSVALLVAAAGLLALPAAAGPLGRRLPPAEWARVAAASAWLGLLALRVGLVFTAAPTVLSAVGLHDMAEACHRVTGPAPPGGSATGWAAAALLVVLVTQELRGRRHTRLAQRALRVEPWFGYHEPRSGYELVVLPTTEPLAYASDGMPVQVVVSQGLLDALTGAELDAVVLHELCHLRHGHHRYLRLATAVASASLGLGRRSAAALQLAVERWADESAAQAPGGRPAVRDALTKCTVTWLAPVPAFNPACTLGARLAALDSAAPTAQLGTRLAVAAPVLALVGLIVAAAVTWTTYDHHGVLGLLCHCSS